MSSMADISEVITQLPNRTPAELKVIHERCAALLALGGKTNAVHMSKQDGDFATDLYGAISDLLFKRTKVRGMPYSVFIKSSAAAKFKEAVQQAAKANDTWFPKQTRTQRLSMCGIYASLILDYIEAREWAAVWSTINHIISDLPAVVDQAFPGYAERGMLDKVQLMRTRPRQFID